ncbi:MAG: hypothetical protein WDN28_22975 [Chthoniobacter sp.]
MLEWADGFSVLDLLKARRELDADEALMLLQQAAAGADEALRLGLNGLEFGLHQLQIHFPQPVEKEKLLRAPIRTWPAFELKLYPLGATRNFVASQTWAGGQTMVGGGKDHSAASGADIRPQYVQALGAVTYEILGGTLSPLTLRGAGGPTARYTRSPRFPRRAMRFYAGRWIRRVPSRRRKNSAMRCRNSTVCRSAATTPGRPVPSLPPPARQRRRNRCRPQPHRPAPPRCRSALHSSPRRPRACPSRSSVASPRRSLWSSPASPFSSCT